MKNLSRKSPRQNNETGDGAADNIRTGGRAILDMENIVSDLDTFSIKILRAIKQLLEELGQRINKIFKAAIDIFRRWAEENPEVIEYIKRAARRKEHYLRRMEYLKSKKKRRRKKAQAWTEAARGGIL